MKKCPEKIELLSDAGYEATTIKCLFEEGHGGSHQRNFKVGEKGVMIRWKRIPPKK